MRSRGVGNVPGEGEREGEGGRVARIHPTME